MDVSQESGQQPTALRLAVNAAGDGALVWRRASYDYLRGAMRPAGGAWGPARQASTAPALDHDVALEDDGNAVLVWYERAGTDSRLHAGRGRDDNWYGHSTVATLDGYIWPQVAVDPAGEAATAVWARDGAVWAAGRDVSAPQLRELLVPATAVAGEPVVLSVSPWDLWGPILSTQWSIRDDTVFADGSYPQELVGEYSGDRVTHTFPVPAVGPRQFRPLRPTRYRVSAKVTDAAGRPAWEGRTISVSVPESAYPKRPTLDFVARSRLRLARLLRAGALPAICRLSDASICRVRADMPAKHARRLGIRGRKRSHRVVLGVGRVVTTTGPAAARLEIKLLAKTRRSLGRIDRRARKATARLRAARRARGRSVPPRLRRAARRARRPIPIRLLAGSLSKGARNFTDHTVRLIHR